MADMHTHSLFSFDGHAAIMEMCEAAVSCGVDILAVTDHFDTDGITEGFYDPYDMTTARAAVKDAADRYRDQLTLIYGIELGQPYTYPDVADRLLQEARFDLVIGSLHNLIHVPDFFYINFHEMPLALCKRLWERSIEEIYTKLIRYPHIDILAHLTYPLRYMSQAGRHIDLKEYTQQLTPLLQELIGRNICLEVNTSGLRQGCGCTLPDMDVVRLYHSLGGRLISVGSDAHSPKDVGASIPEVYDSLHEIGFRYTYAGRQSNGDLRMIPL